MRKVAFITGASRGIGANIAVHLAKMGFDIAITARTVEEGEQRDHSPSVKQTNMTPLPGSLKKTATEIKKYGGDVLMLPADLLERASLAKAVEQVISEWGHIDLLINNGQYIGPGHMDCFLDTPLEMVENHITANLIAPLFLTKKILPQMVARGSGTIINISSAAGLFDPPAPPGEGGWGLGYGVSKAGMNRINGCLHSELVGSGVSCFNVHPGFVAVERMKQDEVSLGVNADHGAPADVVGATVAWIMQNQDLAKPLAGKTIEAQEHCRKYQLLTDWP